MYQKQQKKDYWHFQWNLSVNFLSPYIITVNLSHVTFVGHENLIDTKYEMIILNLNILKLSCPLNLDIH